MALFDINAFSLNHNGPVRNLSLITLGYLRYEERVVYSSVSKFAYEPSERGIGFGVHFRCQHNNKYFVRAAGADWITATAIEPVEDTTRRDCTLFRLNIVSNTSMRWTHVNSNSLVSVVQQSHPTESYYLTIRTNSINQVVCTPIDVERIIKLPKTVVLKGDNGKYLQVESDNFQSFIGEDRHRKETWYETVPVTNGDVHLRNVQSRRLLRRNNNGWIMGDLTATTSNDLNTVFQIARLSDTTIALINRGNNRFCQRMDDKNRLKAEIDSGVKEAELSVEEPIVERRIQVEYRLNDSRIYGEKPRSWLSQVAFNDAKDRDLETTLSVAYTESLSFSFNVTTGISYGTASRTTFSASVPFIAKATQEFEFSFGISVDTSFGKTEEKSESYEFTCKVLVPPGQKRRAKVLALEAKCDVPFSYVMTEVQANGELIKTELEDGVFKGMNGYEFHVQVYDPDRPSTIIYDEPVATRFLPDTLAREKIYLKKN